MRNGGWGGIRTHGELAPTPVFKTGALNRSATHPLRASRSWRGVISYRRYPQRKRAKLSLVVASAASAWHKYAYFQTKGIHQIGRASCRDSVCKYGSIWVGESRLKHNKKETIE